MEKIIENADSQNGDKQHADIQNITDAAALKELLIKERTTKADLEGKNRQLFERAKRAEGFEPDGEGNWIKIVEKSKAGRPKKEESEAPSGESSELDYSQKAFLLAKGIEEFDIVLEEAKKFGGDLKTLKLETLIENPYFKQRLETVRTTKANELAASGGSGKGAAGGGGKATPEYWLAKLGPQEAIPSDLPRELREKIVEGRMAKNKDGKMFYSD